MKWAAWHSYGYGQYTCKLVVRFLKHATQSITRTDWLTESE